MASVLHGCETADLALLIRTSRNRKGGSLRQVAERCGVGRSTLSRWEAGFTRPSRAQLESLIVALNLSDEDRRPFSPFLGETKSADSQATARRRLFRAIRTRNGLSLGDAATQVGVSKAALSRWESGDRVPNRARLGQAARALGATALEIHSIESPGPLFETTNDHLDTLAQEVRRLRTCIPSGFSQVLDREFLGLDAALAQQNSCDARMLRLELRATYVEWLGWWYRDADAGKYAGHLLPALRRHPTSGIWGRLLRAVSNYTMEFKRDPEESIQLLSQACDSLKNGQSEGFVRRELAGLYLAVGEWATAREQLDRARAAGSGEEGTSVHLYCCSMVEAALWSESGNHSRAVQCLPSVHVEDPYLNCSSAIGKSRILARAGDAVGARSVVDEAMKVAQAVEGQHFYLGLAKYLKQELPGA